MMSMPPSPKQSIPDITTGDEQQLQVSILHADNLPKTGLQPSTSRYYVTLTLDDQCRRTISVERGSGPKWNQTFTLAFVPSSVLRIRIFAVRRFQADSIVGGIDEEVSGLLSHPSSKESTITVSLQNSDKKSKRNLGSITLRITVLKQDVDTLLRMDEAVKHAAISFSQSVGTATEINLEPGPWPDFIRLLKDFDATPVVTALDAVAEVHPYTRAAWSIISFSFKVMQDQKRRDNTVDNLAKTMRDMYVLVHASDALRGRKALKGIIIALSKQTAECAYFIQKYATDHGFYTRAVANLFSEADHAITHYSRQFDKLREMLQVLAVVDSAAAVNELDVVVRRILERVDSIPSLSELNNLPYVEGVGFVPEKCCLRGTRVQLLDDIIQWVGSEKADSNIFLLTGTAGCGKSSVAHSIASYFSQQKRLGSSFFFQRGYQGRDSPNHVFSTIARDLADREPVIKQRLCEILENNRSLSGTQSLALQFEEFVLKPTADATTIGPVVIVIDALDECEGPLRRQFLRRLAIGLTALPRNYWTILTARPEDDILSELHAVPHKVWQLMENVDTKSTYDDILAFVRSELSGLRRLPPTLDLVEAASMLTELSQGLFIWASTACKFVKGEGEKGYVFSDRRLERVLDTTPLGIQQRLDELYSTVLETVFPWNEDDSCGPDFLSTVGIVITMRIPLPVPAIVALMGDHIPGIEAHVGCMGSLLSGVADDSIPVRALHPSFGDYLADQGRSGPFSVCRDVINIKLAAASVEFMQMYIEHDLCTPFEAFHSDSNPKIQYNQTALQYACRFWIPHLCSVDSIEESDMQLYLDFTISSLSRWLEVTSTWWDVGLAQTLLAELLAWLEIRISCKTKAVTFARAQLEGLPLTCIPQPLIVRCSALRSTPVLHGGAAEIYQAQLNGKVVALKLYKSYGKPMDGPYRSVNFHICRETLLWKQLRHPNILPLLGMDNNRFSGGLCLVSPWMQHGNITQYMKDPAILEAHTDRCLLEIANGVKYLHSMNISHGCLDCRSILIEDNGNVVLAGFGWAQFGRVLDKHFESDEWPIVALRSVAPELLKGGPSFQTNASDVYAFGCVCIEVYTGNAPFHALPHSMIFDAIAKGAPPLSARPAAGSRKEMPIALWSIVESCWSYNRNDRPTIDEIVKNLHHIPNS